MNLLREIVLDTWARKQAETADVTKVLRARLRELETRREQLVEAFVYREAIDRETYRRKKDKVEAEIAIAEIEAHDAKLEEMDVEACSSLGE